MKRIYFILIPLLLFVNGCYKVNERTSEIYNLNLDCLSQGAWDSIRLYHSADSIKDSALRAKVIKFKQQPFANEVFYFNEDPRELIAVSRDHYSVRYVYNEKISNQVLDGLSPQLPVAEKKRIAMRIQNLLNAHQCPSGVKKSYDWYNRYVWE